MLNVKQRAKMPGNKCSLAFRLFALFYDYLSISVITVWFTKFYFVIVTLAKNLYEYSITKLEYYLFVLRCA